MKILLIAQEPPLDPSKVVTGNAVRNQQLQAGLESGGHQVEHIFLGTGDKLPDNAFSGRDDLRSLLIKTRPDVILITYWELVKLLPYDLEQPVVLDFIAPRPLEQLFEDAGTVANEIRKLKLVLRKCDLILVGNELQKHLLIVPLLEAGFDVRRNLPVEVVPLAGEPVARENADANPSTWTLISGGISWPWRKAAPYWRVITRFHRTLPGNTAKLVLFGGQYPLAHSYEDTELDFETEELKCYEQFSKFLSGSGHIGLELAEQNIERTYSQSFRSLEFLRHGLPLI